MLKKLNKKGFTLIELLVVLTIIAVIIALAIFGIQAAQRVQRDTARKDIASQINALLAVYVQNNGSYPGDGALPISLNAASCPGGYAWTDNNKVTCLGGGGTIDAVPTQAGTSANCAAAAFIAPTSHNLNVCYYSNTTGTTPYTLGVALEGGAVNYVSK